MKKVILVISILLNFIFCVNVNAEIVNNDDENTELIVVESSSEKKELDNNQGFIQKTVVNSDSKKGEVTVQLKLHNALIKEITENQKSEDYEIFLVIDDSGSMISSISTGETRKEAVNNAAKELVGNLLSNYPNVKIGIIKFSSGSTDYPAAEKICDLTNSKDVINQAIDEGEAGYGATNIEAGLILAQESFSNNNISKIIVVLTDGAPNGAETKKDSDGNYLTTDQATKNKLVELDKAGITIISMLTEIDDEESAEYIFGTPENPTVGKYYYIADADIKKIITENIFSDISEIVSNLPIYNISIKDYFPEDVLTYFEFSYVTKPTYGLISEVIGENKSIVYTLDELKGNSSVIIEYKLKLKNMKYQNIIDKVIATNEKVVLDYTDIDGNTHNLVLDSSPTVKLSLYTPSEDEPDQPLENGPQTGLETYGLIIGISLIGILFISQIIKNKNCIKKI